MVSDPALARAVDACAPSSHITFLTARDGCFVPALRGQGDGIPFHSRVDPRKEARRLFEAQGGAGYLVFLGLGAGYQVRPFLEDPRVHRVLIVEKDAQTLKTLLAHVPMAGILADRRVRVLAGPEPGDIRRHVAATYLPAVAGDLRSIPLRPWCESEPGFFSAAAAEIRAAAEASSADYSVQAHFGKRWFQNILHNLPAAETSALDLGPAPVAHVTAAGPSLDIQKLALAARQPGTRLVATDTSLPALIRAGIIPDLVVSIDCQQHGYHHLLPCLPLEAPFALDLASPPVFTRHSTRCAFFAGGHPFARHLRARWRAFPAVDTSGGNVTHAAVSVAGLLGSRTIHLHGADFSYPRGKPYARGTYLFDIFSLRESRLVPLEGSLFAFLFRGADVMTERVEGSLRYTTRILLGYREHLLRLMREIDAVVLPEEGEGLPLANTGSTGAVGDPPDADSGPRALAPEGARCGWKCFLSEYAEEIGLLPLPTSPPAAYFAGLTPAQASLWATLLPIAPVVSRERGASCSRAAAMDEARGWAMARISRLLAVHGE